MHWVEFSGFSITETKLIDVNHKMHPYSARRDKKIFVYDLIRLNIFI